MDECVAFFWLDPALADGRTPAAEAEMDVAEPRARRQA